MKGTILVLLAAVATCGCASFGTRQEDASYDPTTGQITRKITTRASARTFLDAKSSLAKFKATQSDKNQTASAGDIGMQTTGTNAVAILDKIQGIIAALPK